MSKSRTSSPIFCLSFLMCSSLRASSSLGRARSAFSAPSRNRSRHSSISATVSPCFRAGGRSRRLALQDADDQGYPSLRRPPLGGIRGLVRRGHLLDRDLSTVVWVDLILRGA